MGSLAFRAYDANLRRVYMAEFIDHCFLANNPRPFRASLIGNPLAQNQCNDSRLPHVRTSGLGQVRAQSAEPRPVLSKTSMFIE